VQVVVLLSEYGLNMDRFARVDLQDPYHISSSYICKDLKVL